MATTATLKTATDSEDSTKWQTLAAPVVSRVKPPRIKNHEPLMTSVGLATAALGTSLASQLLALERLSSWTDITNDNPLLARVALHNFMRLGGGEIIAGISASKILIEPNLLDYEELKSCICFGLATLTNELNPLSLERRYIELNGLYTRIRDRIDIYLIESEMRSATKQSRGTDAQARRTR